jgi:hypothetical protein
LGCDVSYPNPTDESLETFLEAIANPGTKALSFWRSVKFRNIS